MKENWRPIFNGVYAVSDCGRVKRIKRSHSSTPTGILNPYQKSGYPAVGIWIGGVGRSCYVHELILRAFVGPRTNRMYIDHVDGVKENNSLANLEYVTPAENTQRAYALGLMNPSRGESHRDSRVTETMVREIRRRHRKGLARSLGREFGISHGSILKIVKRRTWAHT